MRRPAPGCEIVRCPQVKTMAAHLNFPRNCPDIQAPTCHSSCGAAPLGGPAEEMERRRRWLTLSRGLPVAAAEMGVRGDL